MNIIGIPLLNYRDLLDESVNRVEHEVYDSPEKHGTFPDPADCEVKTISSAGHAGAEAAFFEEWTDDPESCQQEEEGQELIEYTGDPAPVWKDAVPNVDEHSIDCCQTLEERDEVCNHAREDADYEKKDRDQNLDK